MDKLIVCETDGGRYGVRPISWTGIWNKKGQIREWLNFLALFIEKEDAERFVEWKTAEEQGKLLKLPCKVGDVTYSVRKSHEEIIVAVVERIEIDEGGNWVITSYDDSHRFEDFGKTVFLIKEEAEAARRALKG